jgi:CspA family cold shock protein
MAKGKVKWFNARTGYGYIQVEGGKDVYVQQSAIKTEEDKTLKPGDLVEFDIEQGPKGPQAANVKKVK